VADAFQVMLFKGSELLDSTEQLNQLGDSSTEEIKLAKDLVRRELELLSLWHVKKPFSCELILLLVSLVQV
jgi:hypothetical protein